MTNPAVLYSHNNLLIDHLHRMINMFFLINPVFNPITASINLNNKIDFLEDIILDDYPTHEVQILRYEKILNRKLKSEKIKSYCIAYLTDVKREGKKKSVNAIAFKIRQSFQTEPEILYYEYQFKNNQLLITDIWVE